METKTVLNKVNDYIVQPILDWIYPKHCLSCEAKISEDSQLVCQNCWHNLPMTINSNLNDLWFVREKQASVYLNGYCSFYDFDKLTQKIIHAFKYESKTRLAKEIVKRIIPAILNNPDITSTDWIIPVPLHKRRLKERGFNQSYLLAKEISRYLQIPVNYKIVIRKKYTESQTHLDAAERLNNITGAFKISQPDLIANTAVLLVDDLITTGITMNECAKELSKAGTKQVYALAIAHPI